VFGRNDKRSKHSKVLGVYFSVHVWGGKTPGRIEHRFFGRKYPRPNHVFQIWWRSVKGFSIDWVSNFAIPHWLRRSSLQHSHITVWAFYFDFVRYISRITFEKPTVLHQSKVKHMTDVQKVLSQHITVFKTQTRVRYSEWKSQNPIFDDLKQRRLQKNEVYSCSFRKYNVGAL